MNVSVIGTGYVGLVTGVCLAEKGHQVTCVDIDQKKVDEIRKGISPIHEIGLSDLLKSHIGKNFHVQTNLEKALLESSISLIAVGTPFNGDEIDLSYIKRVSEEIGKTLRIKDEYHVVVVKSTVVPGTTDELVLSCLEWESGKKAGVHFGVGMNPEFLREGEAVADFMNPDRIVIGGIDDRTREMMTDLYEPFQGVEILHCNNRTAEMIKYTANSLLATLISFSNEIGNMCAALEDVDVLDVMRGVHLDKRFSPILKSGERITPGFISYLAAGCGFGGSCFPKDVKALVAHGKRSGQGMDLLNAVIRINEKQPRKIIAMLKKHFEDFHGKRITILGLAFKPGTDDMRESPSIPIVRELLSSGAHLKAYDPVARDEALKVFGNEAISYPEELEDALDESEAVVLLTSWPEFNRLDQLISSMKHKPLIVDGRRVLERDKFDRYEGIGLK